jgi:hypothetical protein
LGEEMEDAVTDALDADTADEFFGKLRGILKKFAPIVSQVAPLLPIPGAGLIGKAAEVIGNVAADDADEMDALDGMIDVADEAEAFEAMAPVTAGLAIRKAVPKAARIPRPERKQLVRATTAAARHIARRHGPRAAVAVPAIVRHARKVAVQRGAPLEQLPQIVRRTAAKVARSPRLVRRFANAAIRMRTRTAPGMPARAGYRGVRYRSPTSGYGPQWGYGPGGSYEGRAARPARYGRYGAPFARSYGYGSGGGAWCPNCGGRSITLQGPVRISIESI